MKPTVTTAVLLAFVILFSSLFAGTPPGDEQGHTGVGLALRRLGTTGTLMMAVAHPDDENNGLLVMLDRGQGIRTTLVSATRGEGGQNEIGPELFEALGLLRTGELEAVHRYDGTEQYFARAIDFGYSFSVDETFEKWGREEITSDFVRFIRTIRPDVLLTMRPEGAGGGQHHQASALIAAEAFKAASDGSRFPEQLRAGLRPWQVTKLYQMESFGLGRGATPVSSGVLQVDTNVWDALLGETYAIIGSQARSQHKSQGMNQLLSLPGPAGVTYRLAATSIASPETETSLFAGIDITIPGLSRFAGSGPPAALKAGLDKIAAHVAEAKRAFAGHEDAGVIRHLAAGLRALRELRSSLDGMGLDDTARFEIDYRLGIEESEFEEALILAQALRLDVLSNDGLVVPGQPLTVTVSAANRGSEPVRIHSVSFEGFEGKPACPVDVVQPGSVYRCQEALTAGQAKLSTPYWTRVPGTARYEYEPDIPFGVPYRPTPFAARMEVDIGGASVSLRLPVRYRYEGNIFSGEKRMNLQVVPRFSVTLTPSIAVVPNPSGGDGRQSTLQSSGRERELRATVVNSTKGPASATVSLLVPEGWTARPPEAVVDFAREDEAASVRFTLVPPAKLSPGRYTVKAVARAGGEDFESGYQVVEYPHVERHHLVKPSVTAVQVIDVTVPPDILVGYVMGVGDEVPAAIEQLGARVELIDADTLAWGDLSVYDAIVTGVRAYERRPDLRAHNNRLLDYVRAGGTMVVQYNKFEFNEADYGPFPAKVSSNRVTDENAPVRVLDASHPVFNWPNTIGEETWDGWVQERGLYFLGDKDPRYVDLVEMEDSFPYNRGVKRGALVEARVGQGRWLYVGLGLWRQLPAGTGGAYRLLANLISLGRHDDRR